MIKSIAFPNMFTRSSTNCVSNKEATMQNLKYLILSEKGELFGDPFYGVGLKKYLFDQNDTIVKDLVLDDMYTAIASFMPQLRISRNDLKLRTGDKGEIFVDIKVKYFTFLTTFYQISLYRKRIKNAST